MPRRLIESVGNAVRGLRFSFRTQRNLSIHTVAGTAAILLGVVLQISTVEMAIVFVVIASVFVLELLNTAIEEIVNMLSLSRKMRAMVAKDVAAAAVLMSSLASVAVGCLIFIPKIINLLIRQ